MVTHPNCDAQSVVMRRGSDDDTGVVSGGGDIYDDINGVFYDDGGDNSVYCCGDKAVCGDVYACGYSCTAGCGAMVVNKDSSEVGKDTDGVGVVGSGDKARGGDIGADIVLGGVAGSVHSDVSDDVSSGCGVIKQKCDAGIIINVDGDVNDVIINVDLISGSQLHSRGANDHKIYDCGSIIENKDSGAINAVTSNGASGTTSGGASDATSGSNDSSGVNDDVILSGASICTSGSNFWASSSRNGSSDSANGASIGGGARGAGGVTNMTLVVLLLLSCGAVITQASSDAIETANSCLLITIPPGLLRALKKMEVKLKQILPIPAPPDLTYIASTVTELSSDLAKLNQEVLVTLNVSQAAHLDEVLLIFNNTYSNTREISEAIIVQNNSTQNLLTEIIQAEDQKRTLLSDTTVTDQENAELISRILVKLADLSGNKTFPEDENELITMDNFVRTNNVSISSNNKSIIVENVVNGGVGSNDNSSTEVVVDGEVFGNENSSVENVVDVGDIISNDLNFDVDLEGDRKPDQPTDLDLLLVELEKQKLDLGLLSERVTVVEAIIAEERHAKKSIDELRQIVHSTQGTQRRKTLEKNELNIKFRHGGTSPYRALDCWDHHRAGHRRSGVYTIFPSKCAGEGVEVWCSMEGEGDASRGGWTVILNRDKNNYLDNNNNNEDNGEIKNEAKTSEENDDFNEENGVESIGRKENKSINDTQNKIDVENRLIEANDNGDNIDDGIIDDNDIDDIDIDNINIDNNNDNGEQKRRTKEEILEELFKIIRSLELSNNNNTTESNNNDDKSIISNTVLNETVSDNDNRSSNITSIINGYNSNGTITEGNIMPITSNNNTINDSSSGSSRWEFDGNFPVNFTRSWEEYQRGFGNPRGEYFLGLNALHEMTQSRRYTLKIIVEGKAGIKQHAVWDKITVMGEQDKYRLDVRGYSERRSNLPNLLAIHHNQPFSTYDRDHDASYDKSCGGLYGGGWWYRRCYDILPTGDWGAQEDSPLGVVMGTLENSPGGLRRKPVAGVRIMIRPSLPPSCGEDAGEDGGTS